MHGVTSLQITLRSLNALETISWYNDINIIYSNYDVWKAHERASALGIVFETL